MSHNSLKFIEKFNFATNKWKYIVILLLLFLSLTNPSMDEHVSVYSFSRDVRLEPKDEGLWHGYNGADRYILMRRVNFYLFSVSKENNTFKRKISIKTIGLAGFVIVL
jgi:hypothetical protein